MMILEYLIHIMWINKEPEEELRDTIQVLKVHGWYIKALMKNEWLIIISKALPLQGPHSYANPCAPYF